MFLAGLPPSKHCAAQSNGTASKHASGFADTLIEDADLYRFLDDQERLLASKSKGLADGRTLASDEGSTCHHHRIDGAP